MGMRTILSLMLVAVAFVVTGYAMWEEHQLDPRSGMTGIAPTADQYRQRVTPKDPLLSLQYLKTLRESNFKAFGMDEEMASATARRARQIEDRHGEHLAALLAAVSDVDALIASFCGQTEGMRPRYGALRFLVEEVGDSRKLINLRRASELERQEWSLIAPIDGVYTELELNEDRKEDATLMAFAAILAGEERKVLEGTSPWGRNLLSGSWSWGEVQQEHRGIAEVVMDYAATMHVAVELVTRDGGMCGGVEAAPAGDAGRGCCAIVAPSPAPNRT